MLSVELTDLGCSPIVNENWPSGIASSIKAGVQAALETSPLPECILILVCDQPGLGLPILRNLLSTHSSQRKIATASRYRETVGVPAVFDREVFAELLQLSGDQGARRILLRHLDQVAAVDFPDGDFDIDTPEDLAQLGLRRS
ncbi:CTP:molybdopterin cytidylyltransferase [Acidisarcina polymorpha]|uniref:CTP:molybdopterin cytidylyltransferase n=2 Tax=Acidisarcina polymorpha TaxID=2211140 RepID=A0A2Z5FSY4_9BACT|nr:CTP:molybdopterin cytidylyltransferase [Acidisarcina polymorpha]